MLAVIVGVRADHVVSGHRFTAAQVSHLNTSAITVAIFSGLVPIVLWLWMAQANSRGRKWARNLSTVLFGVATLDLTGALRTPVIRVNFVPVNFGPTIPVLTWLVGLAVVWLLWRPASTAFFWPGGYAQARHQAQMAELAWIRSSRWPVNAVGARVHGEPQ